MRELGLDHTKVTGAGLAHLSRLTALQTLRVVDTQVTDTRMKKVNKIVERRCLHAEPPGVRSRVI